MILLEEVAQKKEKETMSLKRELVDILPSVEFRNIAY